MRVLQKTAPAGALSPASYPDGGWPIHFVARTLAGRNGVRAGTLWPDQSRQTIRGWSEAYGLQNDGRDWDRLDFVTTLVVRDAAVAAQIIGANMTIEQAQAYLADLEREP